MYIDSTYLQRENNNIDDIEQLFICSICEGIVNKPVQCINCQNNFCEHCIKEWDEKNHSCPMRCKEYSFQKNILFENFLSDILLFKCQKGCGAIIPYSKLEEHLNVTCPNVNSEDFRQKFEDLSFEFEKYKLRFDTKKYTNLKLTKIYENLLVEKAELNTQIRAYENVNEELKLKLLYLDDLINLNDLEKKNENLLEEKDLLDENIYTQLDIQKLNRENKILNRKNERLQIKLNYLKDMKKL
jgi:hypothetical protein